MLTTVRDHLGEAEFAAARARLAGHLPPVILAAVLDHGVPGSGAPGREESV